MSEYDDTLIDISNSLLDRIILFDFRTTAGRSWASVNIDGGKAMVAHGKLLQKAFPDRRARLVEAQAIIEQATTAEGLLEGYFDAEEDHPGELGCDCGPDDPKGRF